MEGGMQRKQSAVSILFCLIIFALLRPQLEEVDCVKRNFIVYLTRQWGAWLLCSLPISNPFMAFLITLKGKGLTSLSHFLLCVSFGLLSIFNQNWDDSSVALLRPLHSLSLRNCLPVQHPLPFSGNFFFENIFKNCEVQSTVATPLYSAIEQFSFCKFDTSSSPKLSSLLFIPEIHAFQAKPYEKKKKTKLYALDFTALALRRNGAYRDFPVGFSPSSRFQNSYLSLGALIDSNFGKKICSKNYLSSTVTKAFHHPVSNHFMPKSYQKYLFGLNIRNREPHHERYALVASRADDGGNSGQDKISPSLKDKGLFLSNFIESLEVEERGDGNSSCLLPDQGKNVDNSKTSDVAGTPGDRRPGISGEPDIESKKNICKSSQASCRVNSELRGNGKEEAESDLQKRIPGGQAPSQSIPSLAVTEEAPPVSTLSNNEVSSSSHGTNPALREGELEVDSADNLEPISLESSRNSRKMNDTWLSECDYNKMIMLQSGGSGNVTSEPLDDQIILKTVGISLFRRLIMSGTPQQQFYAVTVLSDILKHSDPAAIVKDIFSYTEGESNKAVTHLYKFTNISLLNSLISLLEQPRPMGRVWKKFWGTSEDEVDLERLQRPVMEIIYFCAKYGTFDLTSKLLAILKTSKTFLRFSKGTKVTSKIEDLENFPKNFNYVARESVAIPNDAVKKFPQSTDPTGVMEAINNATLSDKTFTSVVFNETLNFLEYPKRLDEQAIAIADSGKSSAAPNTVKSSVPPVLNDEEKRDSTSHFAETILKLFKVAAAPIDTSKSAFSNLFSFSKKMRSALKGLVFSSRGVHKEKEALGAFSPVVSDRGIMTPGSVRIRNDVENLRSDELNFSRDGSSDGKILEASSVSSESRMKKFEFLPGESALEIDDNVSMVFLAQLISKYLERAAGTSEVTVDPSRLTVQQKIVDGYPNQTFVNPSNEGALCYDEKNATNFMANTPLAGTLKTLKRLLLPKYYLNNESKSLQPAVHTARISRKTILGNVELDFNRNDDTHQRDSFLAKQNPHSLGALNNLPPIKFSVKFFFRFCLDRFMWIQSLKEILSSRVFSFVKAHGSNDRESTGRGANAIYWIPYFAPGGITALEAALSSITPFRTAANPSSPLSSQTLCKIIMEKEELAVVGSSDYGISRSSSLGGDTRNFGYGPLVWNVAVLSVPKVLLEGKQKQKKPCNARLSAFLGVSSGSSSYRTVSDLSGTDSDTSRNVKCLANLRLDVSLTPLMAGRSSDTDNANFMNEELAVLKVGINMLRKAIEMGGMFAWKSVYHPTKAGVLSVDKNEIQPPYSFNNSPFMPFASFLRYAARLFWSLDKGVTTTVSSDAQKKISQGPQSSGNSREISVDMQASLATDDSGPSTAQATFNQLLPSLKSTDNTMKEPVPTPVNSTALAPSTEENSSSTVALTNASLLDSVSLSPSDTFTTKEATSEEYEGMLQTVQLINDNTVETTCQTKSEQGDAPVLNTSPEIVDEIPSKRASHAPVLLSTPDIRSAGALRAASSPRDFIPTDTTITGLNKEDTINAAACLKKSQFRNCSSQEKAIRTLDSLLSFYSSSDSLPNVLKADFEAYTKLWLHLLGIVWSATHRSTIFNSSKFPLFAAFPKPTSFTDAELSILDSCMKLLYTISLKMPQVTLPILSAPKVRRNDASTFGSFSRILTLIQDIASSFTFGRKNVNNNLYGYSRARASPEIEAPSLFNHHNTDADTVQSLLEATLSRLFVSPRTPPLTHELPLFSISYKSPTLRFPAYPPPCPNIIRNTSKLLSILGLSKWKPRNTKHRGLRILSLDGGGTRGVMSIALLKHLSAALGKELYEEFDIICGTSTGGIIALLIGGEKASVAELERLYDSLITDIFSKDAAPITSARLVVRQAFYDESAWETILEKTLGNSLMIDSSADPNIPKVMCIATLISQTPSQLAVWRNYNQHPLAEGPPPYSGSCTIRARDALRSTTAAPGFFSTLTLDNVTYCDGALLANNPTAVAINEAKRIYPNVPIEVVVSIGTGKFMPEILENRIGWDGIIHQLICSATNTENIHETVKSLLPKGSYFRFNPDIHQLWSLDETRKDRLVTMKRFAERFFDEVASKSLAELVKILRGSDDNELTPFKKRKNSIFNKYVAYLRPGRKLNNQTVSSHGKQFINESKFSESSHPAMAISRGKGRKNDEFHDEGCLENNEDELINKNDRKLFNKLWSWESRNYKKKNKQNSPGLFTALKRRIGDRNTSENETGGRESVVPNSGTRELLLEIHKRLREEHDLLSI